jgi:hypothetical protein
MRTAPNPFTEELASQLSEVPDASRESRSGEARLSLDWVDAFILSHSELGCAGATR